MLVNLMRHAAEVWRPVLAQAAGQEIDRYTLVSAGVPCFAQPASASRIYAYQQVGVEIDTVVYTTATDEGFRQHDLLVVNDRQFHVLAVKEALLSGIYLELACVEFPQGAKKRLDKEDYE